MAGDSIDGSVKWANRRLGCVLPSRSLAPRRSRRARSQPRRPRPPRRPSLAPGRAPTGSTSRSTTSPARCSETPFRERVVINPFGPVDNGTQCLFGLDYRMAAWRDDEEDPFHTEVGYWLWDAADGQVMRCFMVPRGVHAHRRRPCLGRHRPASSMQAEVGSESYGILSNLYLSASARTVLYQCTVELGDGTWSYDETTTVELAQMPGTPVRPHRPQHHAPSASTARQAPSPPSSEPAARWTTWRTWSSAEVVLERADWRPTASSSWSHTTTAASTCLASHASRRPSAAPASCFVAGSFCLEGDHRRRGGQRARRSAPRGSAGHGASGLGERAAPPRAAARGRAPPRRRAAPRRGAGR